MRQFWLSRRGEVSPPIRMYWCEAVAHESTGEAVARERNGEAVARVRVRPCTGEGDREPVSYVLVGLSLTH